MATSPSDNAHRVVSYSLYSDGTKVNDKYCLSSVWIRKEINRIGKAVLKFDAGSMEQEKFDETDDKTFKPGASIRLDLGNVNSEATVFSGTVVKLGIEVEEKRRAQMVVECRDCAFPATLGRKNKLFENKKDSAVIAEVLKPYGSVSVDATAYQHPSLVQYYCTDWDFALSRADANGLVVTVDNGKIAVKKPDVKGSPVLTVTYGTDLIDFDGHVTAAGQYSQVEAVAWNPARQETVSAKGGAPALNKQGNLAPSDLKGGDKLLYQTDGAIDNNALKAWTDGQALRAGLARYEGSFLFYGHAAAKPGCLIELAGMGKRFNGNVYVGWVEHTVENNSWTTRAGMGLPARNITEEPLVTSPAAGGWLPGIGGLHIGKVKKLNDDPGKENRIQVEVPLLSGSKNTLWARLANFYAGKSRGTFFYPEVGDEVVVGFMNDDPCQPVILGSLYSSQFPPPYTPDAKNNTKAIVTSKKLKIEFDEEKKCITIETPGKNRIEISDDGKRICLADQQKNTVVLDNGGITLDSAKDITLKAKGNITLDAMAKATVKAKNDVALDGMNVKASAKIGFKAQGTATAELSASGQTTVKGAMVMIN